MVQIVIDNATNYKLVGHKLCERYTSITWFPCATYCLNLVLKCVLEFEYVNFWCKTYCLNLVLKGVLEFEYVKFLVTLACRVLIFICNHKWPLNWL